MIALDDSEKDDIILQHISLLQKNMEIKKLYFIHVIRKGILPKFMAEKFTETKQEAPGDVQKKLENKVKKNFDNFQNLDYKVLVKEGEYVEMILRTVREHKIEFLIVGRKANPGLSFANSKISNLVTCSLLFVPNFLTEHYKKVVVSVDFSANARAALSRALLHREKNTQLEIMPVHFYKVPVGYTKLGKTFHEFAAIMKKNAEKEYQRMCEEMKLDQEKLKCEFFLVKSKKRVPKKIFEYAVRKKADLIIIGSRGRTEFASMFMGSNAVKLVDKCYHLPVLVEKDEKNLTFLRSLQMN